MQNILVLGFGVASTAYVSLLDHNKKRVFVVGSPFDFKKIKLAKKLRYIKNDNIKLNFSKNIFFYNNLEDIPFFNFSLIIIGVNSNGFIAIDDCATNICFWDIAEDCCNIHASRCGKTNIHVVAICLGECQVIIFEMCNFAIAHFGVVIELHIWEFLDDAILFPCNI